MTTINQFLNSLEQSFEEDGRKIISDFFIAFSRFEFALKTSIIFAHSRKKRVEPNWDTFLSSISSSFNKKKTIELENAVKYLLENPPKIQSLSNQRLVWVDRIFNLNEPEINRLGQHVRDVRNNLFHGGKFDGKFQAEISRNHILLKSSIIILNDWLDLEPTVKQYFLSPIP